MKIKGKQDVEYWITRNRNGVMIRVYRIDPYDYFSLNEKLNLTVPILIDYMGQGESLADILDERDKLKKDLDWQEKQTLDARRELGNYERRHTKKKWYQFWK